MNITILLSTLRQTIFICSFSGIVASLPFLIADAVEYILSRFSTGQEATSNHSPLLAIAVFIASSYFEPLLSVNTFTGGVPRLIDISIILHSLFLLGLLVLFLNICKI